jgi:hypothetical protein
LECSRMSDFDWVSVNAARIDAEGRAVSPAYVATIVSRFRNEIGGVYNVVAARIESDHKIEAGRALLGVLPNE